MASAPRLERLRKIVQANLDALPDLAIEPIVSDSDASGGVALEPAADCCSKQTTAAPGGAQLEPITTALNTDRRYVWLENAESSYNPSSMTQYPTTITLSKRAVVLPSVNLHRGDLAPATQHFTPIQALARYPYKWCNRLHSQDIASAFFDEGKFWTREWDLYYVWDIDNHAKPLLLVRETQFQDLLGEINAHLELGLRITDQQREDALVSRFPDHPRCTPRYLGRSRSREEYDSMIDNAPGHDFRAAGEAKSPPPDERTLEAFKQLMEESFEAQKAKNKAAKAKKHQERLLKQKTMSDQFKRTQRYLGLRPSAPADASTPSGPPSAIDPVLPTPFDFDESVVFVCVDVESYERAHHKITEVGVATLDTRELARVPPGQDGENWRDLIRARHFRIKENAHLVNSQFVQGCPDKFDFGESTFVPLSEAPAHVAACFSPPFGARHCNDVEGGFGLTKSERIDEKRNIIFLGHDTLGDVRYLQDLGFDPLKVDNLLEALDTAVMYRVWRREQNPTALGRILHGFDIAGYNLHNAGNDAVFTVQAMLGICVRDATIRGSPELDIMRESEKSARLAAALEEAQQKARDEADGWSDHEIDGDGGAPVPLSVRPPKPAPVHTSSTVPSTDNDWGASRGRGRGGNPRRTLYNPSDSSISAGSGRGRGPLYRGQSSGPSYRGQSSGRGKTSDGERFENRVRGRGRGFGRGQGRDSASKPEHNAPDPQVCVSDFD